jgi:hypothetical protein
MSAPLLRVAWPVSLITALFLTIHARPQLPQKTGLKSQIITVGPNVQVSKACEKLAHAEVVIAADATHEGRLLAGSMVERDGFSQTSAYTSLDGGKTWKLVLEKTDKLGCSDPAVAFGPDGAAYFACLTKDADRAPVKRWEITTSRDESQSWSAPVVGHPRAGVEVDRPFLAVDRTQGKFRGQVYCSCLYGDLAVFRSRDGAKTFDAPTYVKCKGATHPSQGKAWGQGVVLSDGTLVFPYCPNPNGRQLSLRVLRSTTGGESFHDEQVLRDYRVEHKVLENMWGFPMMAVDPGSKTFKDRLYLVWAEVSRAGTCVMISLSKDQGVTWSPPVVISDVPDPKEEAKNNSRYALLPTVAVNRSGVVAVTWYDASLPSEDKFRCDLRFRASVDGGATWLPSVAVTNVSSTYAKWTRGSRSSWLGDTAGLAADSTGAFHPLWIDNRTGVRQVFTASVLVKSGHLGGSR